MNIIADDPKDQHIADQMSAMINWKIVKSHSDKHPEFGYSMGEVLCRSLEEAVEYIKNSEYNDLYIEDYKGNNNGVD